MACLQHVSSQSRFEGFSRFNKSALLDVKMYFDKFRKHCSWAHQSFEWRTRWSVRVDHSWLFFLHFGTWRKTIISETTQKISKNIDWLVVNPLLTMMDLRTSWLLQTGFEIDETYLEADSHPRIKTGVSVGWRTQSFHPKWVEITKYPSGQISSRPRLGPQFSIAFWKGSNGTPFIFQKKHLKRLVKYIIPPCGHISIQPKKIHRACFVFRFFFSGGRGQGQTTDPSIESNPTPRNSTLRLHQRVGDVMPKLKVPSQPDVRCLLMWWKPGPDGQGGMMCCCCLFLFCVGWVQCCVVFFVFFGWKATKSQWKKKGRLVYKKNGWLRGGWNFKLQRKLPIVEVQDHFVQSFSKEMVGRKLFVTYSPNCQQFPVQGRSFFWCCRRLFTDASMSVSLGSRCVWTRIMKYFSLVWVRTLSATSIRVHEVLFLSLTYKIFGKIGSKYICRREVSGRLIGVLIGAI